MTAHVQSYLIVPLEGCRASVESRLRAMRGCSVIPALTHDVFVVVAEADDDREREVLEAALHALPDVRGVMLVGGWTDTGAASGGEDVPCR